MYKNQRRAVQLALLTVFLWSTVATAFKLALQSGSVVQTVVIASTVSIIVLTLLFARTENKPSLKQVFIRKPLTYVLSGLINPVLYYVILFAAYDRLPAQIAQPINYTWAIVLTLLSAPILKQKLTKADGIGLLFCYLGVVILVTRFDLGAFDSFDPLGIALAIVSTLFWASYWLLNARPNADALSSILLSFLCAIPWLLALSVWNWNDFSFNSTNLLASIYIGLFEMSLAFVLWLKALNYSTSTAQISALVYLSPFLSLFFINQFLGEPILLSTIVALFVICAGLAIQKGLNHKKKAC